MTQTQRAREGQEDNRTGSHLDAERLADESEESGGEVDGAVLGHGHVHADQVLVRQPVRTLAPEAHWRRDVAQHLVHVRVADATPADKVTVVASYMMLM